MPCCAALCCLLLCHCCVTRSDPGIILTAARFFGPQLALTGLVANKLTVRLQHSSGTCLR